MALPSVNLTVVDGALGIIQPSVANIQLKIGSCSLGTPGTIYAESDPTQALADLGRGPLTEAVCHSLSVAGGTVYALPVAATTAGVAGSVTHSGSGTATLAVTGAPYDDFSVVVDVTTGGAPGTAQGKISLDGGATYQPIITLNTSAIHPANTGLTLTFSGSGSGAFVVGDTYSFLCTQPIMSSSDITTAIATAENDPRTWSWLHIVGPSDTVSDSEAIAVAVDTAMQAAATTKFRYTFAVIECPQDTDANILSGYAAFLSTRVMVCAGFCKLTSSLTGGAPTYNRNAAFPVTARMALSPPSESLGRVPSDSLPGIVSNVRDERLTPGLDAAGFTTLWTFIGKGGFWCPRGHMFAGPTSDYTRSQNRRVMDIACAITYAALLTFLEETMDVQATGANAGHLTDQQASQISAFVNGQLKTGIIANGWAQDSSVVVSQANNVLSDSTINVTTRITPKGYAETITETIGFYNPGLQLQSAS